MKKTLLESANYQLAARLEQSTKVELRPLSILIPKKSSLFIFLTFKNGNYLRNYLLCGTSNYLKISYLQLLKL